ncbi:MAG: Wzz/FepE/Etk N-terminal domain-containing protein, partial [Gemmatimonadota bacterium]
MTGEQKPDPQRTSAPAGGIADDEISLWEVLAVLLRRRGVIVASTFVVAALAVTFALLRAPSFSTSASFQPQGTEASQSQLLALASQFGVNVGAGGGELSPAFYAELLTSREILLRVAESDFQVEGETVRLVDLLEIEDDTEALRLKQAIEWLRESAISVQTGRETGIVTVEVATDWPDLSFQIAERVLHEVSRFNLETRQSQAATERSFIEARVDNAQRDLQEAENELQAFLQANRQFQDSPELAFQYERLQRNVSLRQQVYTTLVQSFEQARIAEVRDTPVMTVLQPPFMPPGPDERRLKLFLALGLVLGAMGGTVLAFVVEAFTRPGSGDPAREDFQRSLDGFLASFGIRRRA